MPIRPAREDDLELILELIKDLALYEKSPEQVRTGLDDLQVALFGDHPHVFAVIAETDSGEVAGFALFYLTFSTWEGVPGLHLEDLYVREKFRGQGFGGALLRHLAEVATERGYARLEWSVLDWNTPAIEVYDAMGASPLREWIGYRLSGEPLAALATRK